MTIGTVRCTSCGETRAGRLVDGGGTDPFLEECPDCGSAEYVDVVDDSG